ncbi:vitamin K epoxide reductase family protein [Candidatus Woesearchaeota archaeon]|nr:vitamin K epoxide reductase family protein [Candidatus Woesearchaeota archaeon]
MTHAWTIPLAIAGIAISAFIWYKKASHQRLVCPLGEDCNKVVNGAYSTVFGVPNEGLGIAYYAFILLAALLASAGTTSVAGIALSTLVLIASGAAAVFGIFLFGIQAFVIRSFCAYCIASSAISVAIFLIELL